MITVAFPYDPQLVEKVKPIEGRKWHKDRKCWSFPDSDGTLERILKVFKDEEIHIDPALQSRLSASIVERRNALPVIAMGKAQGITPHASQITDYNFEDLRRELVSRKYSYRSEVKLK
mgnify:CR=1 FL=1|jgi:hypothetical protein